MERGRQWRPRLPISNYLLVLWLDLDDRGAVIAADPEGRTRGRVVHEHAAHVGVARQLILDRLAGLGIKPYHAVGGHAAGPQLAVLVPDHVIGMRVPGRQRKLLHPFLFGVEHRDLVATILREPEAILLV